MEHKPGYCAVGGFVTPVQYGVAPFGPCAVTQSRSDRHTVPQTALHVGHCVTQL